jgi:hypothetical protein
LAPSFSVFLNIQVAILPGSIVYEINFPGAQHGGRALKTLRIVENMASVRLNLANQGVRLAKR